MSATQHVPMANRFRVRRSRGAVSGLALVLLGIWGALICFIGPIFHYAYSPATAWTYTNGRLWLEILPGAATVVAGLILLGSTNRLTGLFAGWLAAAAGAWFVVGPILSTLWTVHTPAAGVPVGVSTVQRVVEQIGFFAGLGVVITFFAALAVGRMSVLGVRDVTPTDEERRLEAERHAERERELEERAEREHTEEHPDEHAREGEHHVHRADPVEAERS